VITSGEEADAYSLLDADGGRVTMLVRTDGLLLSLPRVQFARGIAPVALAEAQPATLVLWSGDQELRRQPVALSPGGVHEIRL